MLQLGDALRNRRLRQMDFLGRPREALLLHHCAEDLQLPEVEVHDGDCTREMGSSGLPFIASGTGTDGSGSIRMRRRMLPLSLNISSGTGTGTGRTSDAETGCIRARSPVQSLPMKIDTTLPVAPCSGPPRRRRHARVPHPSIRGFEEPIPLDRKPRRLHRSLRRREQARGGAGGGSPQRDPDGAAVGARLRRHDRVRAIPRAARSIHGPDLPRTRVSAAPDLGPRRRGQRARDPLSCSRRSR